VGEREFQSNHAEHLSWDLTRRRRLGNRWLVKSFLLLAVLILPVQSKCQTNEQTCRFEALAMLESGQNDFLIGPKGEISRYQMMKNVWRDESELSYSVATNQAAALVVAERVMSERIAHFDRLHGRWPEAREWPLLWHCPGRLNRPNGGDIDYQRRFLNLLAYYERNSKSIKQLTK
jgi:hypothetical protein